MKITYKIQNYKKENDIFIETDTSDYELTFTHTNSPFQWYICVNGVMTKQKLDITNYHLYRNNFVKAIVLYKTINKSNIVKNIITEGKIQVLYSSKIRYILNKYLKKEFIEKSRDKQTKLGLYIEIINHESK